MLQNSFSILKRFCNLSHRQYEELQNPFQIKPGKCPIKIQKSDQIHILLYYFEIILHINSPNQYIVLENNITKIKYITHKNFNMLTQNDHF